MQEVIQKIKQEYAVLADRVRSLRSFIGSEKFDELSPEEKSLYKLRLRQMEPLVETLKRQLQFYSVIPTTEEIEYSEDEADLNSDETGDDTSEGTGEV